jgi:hypothetical protein
LAHLRKYSELRLSVTNNNSPQSRREPEAARGAFGTRPTLEIRGNEGSEAALTGVDFNRVFVLSDFQKMFIDFIKTLE